MKLKKLSVTAILFAFTIITYIVASVLFCYTTKPKIAECEFPFSITYEYKGETKTLSGVYECEYSGSDTIHGEHNRYWAGEAKYENPENAEEPYIVDQSDKKQTILTVHENMHAGYFMGDPLYKDSYEESGFEGVEPFIEYYDYKNDISLNDENKDEILKSIDFKIIDYTYAEPIENSFSFSGICYEADNIVIFVAISLVFFILCLIFVRKDEECERSDLYKCGVIFNYITGIVAVPFLTVVCTMYGLVGSGIELIDQIIYNIPSIAVLCLALSVVLRRKGFIKKGFYIQFGGILLFAIMYLLITLFEG